MSLTSTTWIKASKCTRSHSKAFIEIRANYEQYNNSFLPRTIKDWNALPTHLVHATSVDEFDSRLQSCCQFKSLLRCLVKNISLLQSVPLFTGLFQELECLVYGMGLILLKCTRDVVVLMK
jgi:hypothetical protein